VAVGDALDDLRQGADQRVNPLPRDEATGRDDAVRDLDWVILEEDRLDGRCR